ncbi:hydroxymethylbilane synthase [Dethiobacter alkaliphilus]|uniref:Porphobilinogen deaminase n=1 Tax=Dethiobacter alkaliphilus AHT 1 TaxID=555088 RepID=C0GG56_DETAL|nr:hydroxymethylbilane synthase [Dethiobacter alkaliphilus]EEG77745.1 porphobilinogen deaminase [Dethiobacter alkaliphilus AHT 1]
MKKTIVVGSRDSELALTQTHFVIGELQKHFPDVDFTVKHIKTEGDKILDVALSKIGDKGLFVKEIENALLSKEIDFAVHSMKDVPTAVPDGLQITTITEREDPRDCYIAKDGKTRLFDTPQGAVIGTSSLRRSAQLLHQRSDFEIVPIRGNLNTRFRKLSEQDMHGIILAYAGVYRLGWADKITEIIDFEKSLPAVGQGALGIETRSDDDFTINIVSALNHDTTASAILAERAFLRQLEGGCQVPIGAYGRLEAEELVLDGVVAGLDGSTVLRDQVRGSADESDALGKKLAQKMVERGADEILKQVRQEFDANA